MKQLIKRFFLEQSGAHAIEMAIVAPVLFLLIMCGFEFGLIMYSASLLETITAQAARFGKTGFDYGDGADQTFRGGAKEGFAAGSSGGHYSVDADGNVTMRSREVFIRNYIRQTGSALLDPEHISVSTRVADSIQNVALGMETAPYGTGRNTDVVMLTVRYDWQILTPFMLVFGTNGEFPIRTTAVVQNER